MKRTYTFEIDQETAERAERVFRARGLSAELVVGMYFQRVAILGRLPYDPVAPVGGGDEGEDGTQPPVVFSHPAPGNTTITRAMAEHLWNAFHANLSTRRAAISVAADVGRKTGMNQGSAFMYLTILGNMVEGKPCTRSMKIADLAYYLGRIYDDLGEPAYSNARKSLRESLAYWEEYIPGKFADKVREILAQTDSSPPKSVSYSSRESLILPITLIPADRNEFKQLLCAHGATIHEHHTDGSVKDIPWAAERMSDTSNVIGNLRSRPDYRKGTWQRLGIKRLVVEINERREEERK